VSAVGLQQPHQELDCGGFSCAIPAEETKNGSRRYFEVEARQCWLPLEGFTESPRFDHPVTHGFLRMPFPRDAAPVRFQTVFLSRHPSAPDRRADQARTERSS